MEYYAGIDVSLDTVSVCIVDGTGKIVREAKVATEPDALVSWFLGLGLVAVTTLPGLDPRKPSVHTSD